MHSKIQKISLFFICALFLLCFSGCSNLSKGATDQQIKQAIEMESELTKLNCKIDEMEITKRQTDKDQKYDLAWVNISASSELGSMTASYEVYSVLYNDGWIVEDVDGDNFQFYANEPVSVDMLGEDMFNLIDEKFGDENIYSIPFTTTFEPIDAEEGAQTCTYTYLLQRIYDYLTVDYTVTLVYHFAPGCYASDWTLSPNETNITENSYTWNIQGTWSAEVSGQLCSLTVNSVEGDKVNLNFTLGDATTGDMQCYITQYDRDRAYISGITMELPNLYTSFPESNVSILIYPGLVELSIGSGSGLEYQIDPEWSFNKSYSGWFTKN